MKKLEDIIHNLNQLFNSNKYSVQKHFEVLHLYCDGTLLKTSKDEDEMTRFCNDLFKIYSDLNNKTGG